MWCYLFLLLGVGACCRVLVVVCYVSVGVVRCVWLRVVCCVLFDDCCLLYVSVRCCLFLLVGVGVSCWVFVVDY